MVNYSASPKKINLHFRMLIWNHQNKQFLLCRAKKKTKTYQPIHLYISYTKLNIRIVTKSWLYKIKNLHFSQLLWLAVRLVNPVTDDHISKCIIGGKTTSARRHRKHSGYNWINNWVCVAVKDKLIDRHWNTFHLSYICEVWQRSVKAWRVADSSMCNFYPFA